MKFTLGWLKDHLATDAPLDDIVERLTMLGLEVEGVENPATDFADFRAARVVEAKQHPDADRLRVCMVDTGSETVQVVCGAPNARTGLKGVFAPVGQLRPRHGAAPEEEQDPRRRIERHAAVGARARACRTSMPGSSSCPRIRRSARPSQRCSASTSR